MNKFFAAVCLLMLAACGQQNQSSVMDEIEKSQKADAAAAAANSEAGLKFLAENKKRPGVIVTKSGLQYEVVKSGDKGAKPPGPEDTVSVDYEGTLIDGTVFDSSYERPGQPARFQVGGVIAGWTEALQLMHPGEQVRLVIPAELAYGDQDKGDIPPKSVLVFKVELHGYVTEDGKKVGKY
jgi:FKBP-type peptidyl-prolyl cis-trans isomerase